MRLRHGWYLALLASLVTTTAAPAPGEEQFTLEQVLSSPFPSQLVASPDGGAFAWTLDENGARNLWIATAPAFQGRRLTSWTEDDGEALSSLSWVPDASAIVFVRGGAANRGGEYPNPLSIVEPRDRSVWVADATTGATRRLATGSSPAVAPTSEGVAYLSGGQIWWVALSGEPEPEEMVSARGSSGNLRWAPDGSRLAFVSSRGDHAFIGVYEPGTDEVRWIDPSVDQDDAPVWSPDGDRIAFVRVPADSGQTAIFRPVRASLPWSIHLAEVTTGESREVWRADEDLGSAFHGIAATDQLLWGAGDHVVFPWERNGWTNLYSLDLTSGRAAAIAPGEYEVEAAVLSPARDEVLFVANREDIDRRHIWKASVAGGDATAVTSGTGIEWSPAPADGAMGWLAADARWPARAVVRVHEAAPRDIAPAALPGDFPTNELVEPEGVVFAAADGMPIHGQLFLPREPTRERRPALLFFHGGSRRQMLLGWHYMGYYHNAYAFNQYMASQGWVVLSVNYRSGIGYGMEFREAIDYGAAGASEFNDVLGAGLYLRGRDDVDPDRIALWGGSYGGYLTALGLARASDLFAAGVDLHGVHDWNVVIRNFVPSYDPVRAAELARIAFDASPMADIDKWRSPVLVIHGDDDRNVPFSETVDLVAALRPRGVRVDQLVFPDEVHSFLLHRNWLRALTAAAGFLQRELGTGH